MKTFICKVGASNYYLVNDGAGGFLNPPGQAEHNYSVQEYRGGHAVGFMSLSYAAESDYLPSKVKLVARRKLESAQGNPTDEAWIQSVYNYFRNCYSPDGINHNAGDCLIGKDYPAENHLAYLFIKQYDPEHTPRLDLIEKSGPLGDWHNPSK